MNITKNFKVGNKLDLYGTIATLQIVDFNSHYTTEDRKLTRFKPITLTEEWHNKFGVKKDGFKSFVYILPRKLNINIKIVFQVIMYSLDKETEREKTM